jgi:uracil-DNA glycosylase
MMPEKIVQIEDSWYALLSLEFQKQYFIELKAFLKEERAKKQTIFPPGPTIFNAFDKTPFEKVKVVILGQDPYHNVGQAMGLSFSVPKGVRIPPSLANIYKEIKRDFGYAIPSHGDLTTWAEQGVFLLNAILTVRENQAGSHRKIGWEQFTNQVIQTLSNEKEGLVFMLWGNFAREKKKLIDANKHLILESAHPSPLAGNRFYGNNHFSQCNEYLRSKNNQVINWQII